MPKTARFLAIKEIISSSPVSNQEDLRRQLTKRGFRVTQATLSRDLKEMEVVRVPSPEGNRYVIQSKGDLKSLKPLVGAEIVSIEASEAMIVIRTLPGCASSVAEYIDQIKSGDILGTVAGDNTILVVPRSQRLAATLAKQIREKLVGV